MAGIGMLVLSPAEENPVAFQPERHASQRGDVQETVICFVCAFRLCQHPLGEELNTIARRLNVGMSTYTGDGTEAMEYTAWVVFINIHSLFVYKTRYLI